MFCNSAINCSHFLQSYRTASGTPAFCIGSSQHLERMEIGSFTSRARKRGGGERGNDSFQSFLVSNNEGC